MGLKRIGTCYSGTNMAAQNRNVTVLFSLIASMTVGAIILMASDNHPPIPGPFSLSSYLQLGPAGEAVKNTHTTASDRWDRVEVYYSQTAGGKADELALLMDLTTGHKAEFHFVICNGNGSFDGEIQAGEYWKQQRPCSSLKGVVRVCVISEGMAESITDCQVQRTYELIDSLQRRFNIPRGNIQYPLDWQM